MLLAPGTKLGPYEIVSSLGAGGMGEVYRAKDKRLDRTVAIKVLPQELSNDPVRKQRFEREAKTISCLNHPHICTLHDIGSQDGLDYLVMECIEGETLAKRLEKGPLPLDQVLNYGAQIADALDKAHRAGIVHRDLKPGNIMLTSTGTKLLDFGLARPVAPSATLATLTMAAPAQAPVTQEGTIVGTFQYMSPEQVEGKEVDGRSDIFSMGAVLYEMVTGKRAFEGKSQLSVASAILEKEPAAISEVRRMTPPALDHTIRRCLAKDPDQRWQTARDLALELKWITESSAQIATVRTPGNEKVARQGLAWIVAAILGVAAGLIAFLHWGRKPPIEAPVRFELSLPPGSSFFAVSPNGRWLAFAAPGADGRRVVWIRALDSLEPRSLPGTENVFGPAVFWSFDSRFIAFQTGSKLKRIDISGGPPQAICDASFTILGGAWSRGDTIILGTLGNGIMEVLAAGGVPKSVTSVSGRNEVHVFPFFLPDGRHFGYLRAPENPGICIGSLDSKPEQQSSRRIVATRVMGVYAASAGTSFGELLFMREGSLLTQPFDERRLEVVGEPVPLAQQVASYLLSASFSASSGVLTYRPGKTGLGVSALTWFDRQGKELGTAGEPGMSVYLDLALSPDGRTVAESRGDPNALGAGIWLLDLTRGVSTRFNVDFSNVFASIWSPDGSRIAFAAFGSGGAGIYQRIANGTGKEQALVVPNSDPMVPTDWSRDGRYLVYTREDAQTRSDLWVLPLASDGTPSGTPAPFANTRFNEGQGQFSPNTHWIAYVSDESGRSEVYVQAFPVPAGGGSKLQISRDGGRQPRWRRDGKELFYLSLDGALIAVDVHGESALQAGGPHALFKVPGAQEQSDFSASFPWDVTPDGKRFLISKAKTSSEPLTVVLNWTAEMEKK